MSLMRLTLEGGRMAFQPGDIVRATAEWDLPGLPEAVVASLIWTLSGTAGEEGVGVEQALDRPQSRERRTFELQAPSGPYSYQGKLFSIGWVVEIRADPDGESERVDIVIGPGATPLVVKA